MCLFSRKLFNSFGQQNALTFVRLVESSGICLIIRKEWPLSDQYKHCSLSRYYKSLVFVWLIESIGLCLVRRKPQSLSIYQKELVFARLVESTGICMVSTKHQSLSGNQKSHIFVLLVESNKMCLVSTKHCSLSGQQKAQALSCNPFEARRVQRGPHPLWLLYALGVYTQQENWYQQIRIQ